MKIEITPELVEQWRNEWKPTSIGDFYVTYIAQRAADHVVQQLLAMDMEPVANFVSDSDEACHVDWLVHQGPPMVDGDKLYTATKLAAARLQGAEEERKRSESECDAITEMNHAQWLALENVRTLASRNRKEEWAQHMLRFCESAGSVPNPLRQQASAVNQGLLMALNAMLTHMGMDEDEWNKPTFDQARAAMLRAQAQEIERLLRQLNQEATARENVSLICDTLRTENKRLYSTLAWIASVNACDYEYQARARAALKEKA